MPGQPSLLPVASHAARCWGGSSSRMPCYTLQVLWEGQELRALLVSPGSSRTAHNSKCVTMPNRHELSYPRRTHAAALMMAAAAAPVEGVLLCRWPAPPAPLAARAACCLHHHLHLRHCIAGAATAVPVPPDACSSSTCRAGSSSIAGCRVGADLESRPAAGAAAYAWAAGKARARPLQP